MTRQDMIENLEYLCGGINALYTISTKDSSFQELLDTWATLAESVLTALEDEEREDVRRGND
jgi:hypothetical protein